MPGFCHSIRPLLQRAFSNLASFSFSSKCGFNRSVPTMSLQFPVLCELGESLGSRPPATRIWFENWLSCHVRLKNSGSIGCTGCGKLTSLESWWRCGAYAAADARSCIGFRLRSVSVLLWLCRAWWKRQVHLPEIGTLSQCFTHGLAAASTSRIAQTLHSSLSYLPKRRTFSDRIAADLQVTQSGRLFSIVAILVQLPAARRHDP